MDENLVKELNKFLKGIHMGEETFKDYLKKAQDNELIVVLTEIIQSFERHDEAMTNRISELGGKPIDAAIKAIDMGLKNGNKFIDEHKDIDPKILSDMKAIVDDYDSSLMKVKKIKDKFQ